MNPFPFAMLTINKMHFREKGVKHHICPKQNLSFSLRERDARSVGRARHCRKSPASNKLRNTNAGADESAVRQFDQYLSPGDVLCYDNAFLQAYRTVRQWLKARGEVMHAAWRMR
jgi:hypothetical protein